MKKLYTALLLMCFPLLVSVLQAQSAHSFKGLITALNINPKGLIQACPHFPQSALQDNDADISADLSNWITLFPKEWGNFLDLSEIDIHSVNWESYGIDKSYIPTKEEVFGNSMWQWYIESGISTQRSNELFPHFPHPKSVSSNQSDLDNYSAELEKWWDQYPMEYEAFLNAPELTALNPFYTGYHSVNRKGPRVAVPKFMMYPVTKEKPIFVDHGCDDTDNNIYALKLQKWYFLYHKDEYLKIYGELPIIPEDMNLDESEAKMARVLEKYYNNPCQNAAK